MCRIEKVHAIYTYEAVQKNHIDDSILILALSLYWAKMDSVK